MTSFLVIPAKAGIQVLRALTEFLDPGFHRGDDFLRGLQFWRAKKTVRPPTLAFSLLTAGGLES
jgi:hypothetical protein